MPDEWDPQERPEDTEVTIDTHRREREVEPGLAPRVNRGTR